MKRVGWLLLCVVLVVLLPVGAEGPDDQFIRVYRLIQQGDTLAANGRPGEASERYREALAHLQQLEREFPGWNRQIVEFRQQYLEERIGTRTGLSPAPGTTPARAPAPPADPRLAAMQAELEQLRVERETLEAKLREALSAQPAAIDPRELVKAEERIAALEREANELRAAVTAKDRELADAARPDRLAEAERDLAAAREQLAQQTNALATLREEQASLRRQLDEALERATTPRAVQTVPDPQTEQQLAAANLQVAELRERIRRLEAEAAAERDRARSLAGEKQLLEQRVADLRRQQEEALARAATPPPVQVVPDPQAEQQLEAANVQIAGLRERIGRLEVELASERERFLSAQRDNAALEQRVADLRSEQVRVAESSPPPEAPAAPQPPPPSPRETPAPVTTATEPPVDPKRERALAKYQREVDRTKIQQLERERDELSKRLRVMTRQLEDLRRQTVGTNLVPGTDQLAILRARLEAYEARAVPYTAEELALMKPTAAMNAEREQRTSQRQLRQIPAGAATLLEEAKQAFILRRYDTAEGKIQQALMLDDRNADMLTYLAAAQLEQDRLEQAEASLKRALEVDPQNADGVSLLGLLRFRQGNYDEAFDLLSQAAQLNPDNAYTQNYLGVTLNQRGQRKAAETALRRAVALDPTYGEAHANLAAVYALHQPPFLELARWHYDKALALGGRRNAELEKRLAAAAPATPASPEETP